MAQIKIPIELPDDWYDKVAEKLVEKGDFVLVTRCKDCKYYRIGNPNANYCYQGRYNELSQSASYEPDDFCSYAEQKESEGGVGNDKQ